jgi:hypothetical protein
VPYFHITVTAPPNYARCCEPISATAMVADAGQCRGDHRACPRSALRRRHRRGARRAAPPGPSSSVYTRTFIAWSAAAGSPKTPAPGTRRGGTSWFPSRLLPGWYGANSGRCCRRSVLISSSPTPHGASLGSSTSPPGEMVNRRCSTTSPATFSHRSHQRTYRQPRRRYGHLPIQGTQDRPSANGLNGGEFMRRFLQHVLPRGFHKVGYFGLWHSAQRHRPPGCGRCCNSRRHPLPS